jgi:transglutaminase-like putative cysteine protease
MRRDAIAPYLAASATLLACAALVPVVAAHSWPYYSFLMVCVVTGSGIALRATTRSRVLIVAGQVAIGVVVLTMLFARDNAVLGLLPGPHALSDLGQLARDGMEATKQFSTPAPDVLGLKFLVVVGVFGVAVAVDALAVTGGTSVGAGLPLLVLYCVPAAVLPHGASAWSCAAVAGGWLVLLAHDGRLRIDGWGRVLRTGPESGRRRFGDDLEVLGTSARRLGVLTVGAAIVVPLLLPSLPNGLIGPAGSGDGTGTGGSGRGGTSVDPILTLRQNLTARSAAPVLTYTTDQANPPLLRLVTDDRFDGETWRSSDGRSSTQLSIDNLQLPDPPGLSSIVTATSHQMRVKVGTLSQGYLPVPYPARQVEVSGTWVYAPDTLDILSRGRSTKGLSYTVTYLDVQPTAAQLQQAGSPSADLVDRYTQVPNVVAPDVAVLARQLTKSAPTEYDKAVALQQYFRADGGFVYDTSVDTSRDTDAVSTFLASKHGYCVQFASAMAVMARTLGIPARLGVGFLPGTKQANGRQGVSLNDAHAWPELYFEGAGWVRFEPTPAVRTGPAPGYSTPNVSVLPTSTSSVTGTAAPTSSGAKPKPDVQQGPVFGNGSSNPTGLSRFRLPVKVWVLIGLVGAGLLATPLAAVVNRWRRRRGARDADARTEAAWAELLERVDDLGIVLPEGATPRQIQVELVARASLAPEPAMALGRLVGAIERVRYAPPSGREPVDLDAPEPGDDVAQVVRAVRAGRDRASRLRARVVPRSGTERLVGLSARAGERIAGVDRRIARTGRSVARGPGDRRHTRRPAKIFGRRSH